MNYKRINSSENRGCAGLVERNKKRAVGKPDREHPVLNGLGGRKHHGGRADRIVHARQSQTNATHLEGTLLVKIMGLLLPVGGVLEDVRGRQLLGKRQQQSQQPHFPGTLCHVIQSENQRASCWLSVTGSRQKSFRQFGLKLDNCHFVVRHVVHGVTNATYAIP